MNTLSENDCIILIWISRHIGMHENEITEKAAQTALLTDISNPKILYTDLKPTINKFIHDKSQKHGTIK